MKKNQITSSDIRMIELNLAAPKEDRVKEYVRQVKNPNVIHVGKVIVEMEYLTCGRSLQDALTETMLYRSSNVSACQDSTKE